MTSSWKKRFIWTAMAAALPIAAASCASDSVDTATTAIESDTSEVQEEVGIDETSIATTVPEPTVAPLEAIPEPTPEPEATASAEPETNGVDVASFAALVLPDYVADVVGDDYSSYMVEVEPGINVHVLEVGSGYPVYLQHGAPTSGLLYRKVAELLPPDQFRVIMPTMVGLGFSTKVSAEQHTLDNHARWMNQTLNALELDEVIYAGHDWGGPVGMGALARSPELLHGAVMLNTTFGAPTGPVEFSPALQGVLAPVPTELEPVIVGSIFDQLSLAQNDPASFSSEVADLYRRPVLESDNVIGPLAIVRMAADSPEHPTAEVLREIDVYLDQLDVPAEIVWGINDPFLGDQLANMMQFFPGAPVTKTEAGHFLQEEVDVPEEIAAAIQRVRDQIESQ